MSISELLNESVHEVKMCSFLTVFFLRFICMYICVCVDFWHAGAGGDGKRVQFPPVVPPRSSPKEVIFTLLQFTHRTCMLDIFVVYSIYVLSHLVPVIDNILYVIRSTGVHLVKCNLYWAEACVISFQFCYLLFYSYYYYFFKPTSIKPQAWKLNFKAKTTTTIIINIIIISYSKYIEKKQK